MKTIKNYFRIIGEKLRSISTKRLILFCVLFFLSLFIVLSFFRKSLSKEYIDTINYNDEYYKTSNTVSGNQTYTNVFLGYKDQKLEFINTDFELDNQYYRGSLIDNSNEEYGTIVNEYQKINVDNNEVYYLSEDNKLEIEINGIQNGIHYLAIDYYELTEIIDNNQIEIKINGKTPFHESQTIVLPSIWVFENDEFGTDRYGNEIQSSSVKEYAWRSQVLYDYKGIHPNYYGFHLKNGDKIEISFINNELLIGEVKIVSVEEIASYEDYKKQYQSVSKATEKIEISARDMELRNEPSIRLRNEQNPKNMYYDTQKLKLNTIFSESWQNGGQSVTYKIEVSETAIYNLSVKYRQNLVNEMPVYRKVLIDGKVPFDLFESYAFPYTTGFLNRIFTDQNGDEVGIYLEKGTHTITLEAVNYPYRTAIEKIKEIMAEIQDLALKVKRYTSGGNDPYRDWDIETYFPNAKSDMLVWADELDELYGSLSKLSNYSKPSEIANLQQSATRLRSIAKDINKLPSKMVQFSDGDSSVNQLLGATMQRLMISGLEIERITVYNNSSVTKPYSNIFVTVFEEIKRLILSYTNSPYSIDNSNDNELRVWVNHPRQYIEIMQAMIDEKYDGNMRVTLSQMPDQNKLILANASGDSPDMAIGVDHWIPYDFAIRDASLDLRQFAGYEELVKNFSKGAMIPYVFEDGVFGLPETQNFWVTFYRKDILNSIGVDHVPQTWDEVKELLPVLQSYDLNYFIPLAQYTGLKPFVATLPFIYQFGGDLYTEDGMQTAINSSETLVGMRLMSELFTLYNMPEYVASFYNQFRYGMIPIGVSDLSTYILLQTAALELDGLWELDLHPGNFDEASGEIVRYAASGAQSSMIMSTTKYADESWKFLSWWMSTSVQSEFAFVLQNTYGKAYLWNTANLNAFRQLSIPKKHKDVILAQWEYALEASRIPGSYMVEREISNAWTKMVFDGANPRLSLDEAVRISNREILYKMAEFGYVKNGEIVKSYPVPSIYTIDKWLTEVDNA
ncbi:MAG: extracellular solute-binding protein [Acholeplasma sp.]|nr:extracellular solute-binding protein [Acholeplasma sp.]